MSEAILVVGGNGFIGARLVQAFAAKGKSVLAVVRDVSAVPARPGVRLVPEPGTPAGFAALLSECQAVIHAASRSTPGASAGKALAEVHGNLVPLANLLEALQLNPLPLLYLSSAGAVYDNESGCRANETAACRPRSYHGAAKLAAEYFIRAWADQFGGTATLLRPSNVYGPGQSARTGFAIIPTAMERIIRGEPLTIWGDGSTRRDYLYIDDLVGLCMRVVESAAPAGVRTINAASGRSVTLAELLSLIESVAGRRLARQFEPARAVDAPDISIDPSLALRELGWQASTPLEAGIRHTWQIFADSMR